MNIAMQLEAPRQNKNILPARASTRAYIVFAAKSEQWIRWKRIFPKKEM